MLQGRLRNTDLVRTQCKHRAVFLQWGGKQVKQPYSGCLQDTSYLHTAQLFIFTSVFAPDVDILILGSSRKMFLNASYLQRNRASHQCRQ